MNKSDWVGLAGPVASLRQLGTIARFFKLSTPTAEVYVFSVAAALLMSFLCWQHIRRSRAHGLPRRKATAFRRLAVLYGCLGFASLSPAAYRWAYKNLPWFERSNPASDPIVGGRLPTGRLVPRVFAAESGRLRAENVILDTARTSVSCVAARDENKSPDERSNGMIARSLASLRTDSNFPIWIQGEVWAGRLRRTQAV